MRRILAAIIFPGSVTIAFAADAASGAPQSDAAIWGVVGVLGAALIAGSVAYYNQATQLRAKAETDAHEAKAARRQRQRELALSIVQTIADDRSAARRFAIGLLKVEFVCDMPPTASSDLLGTTKFIPVNSRITLGRDKDNDIHLYEAAIKSDKEDINRELSRFHCGFLADQNSVFIEDYHSVNGTYLADPQGNELLVMRGEELRFSRLSHSRVLADKDLIWVGPFVLRFVQLKVNTTLLH